MTDAELAELLRGVLSRPDDVELLRVYADVLIERGDARGEMITVQLARVADDSPELEVRDRELGVQLAQELGTKLQQQVECRWRLGFVDAIELVPSSSGASLATSLRALASDVVARRLRRLAIRHAPPGWDSLQTALGVLTRVVPQLKSFRELAVAGDDTQSLGDLAAFSKACPKLEVLELDVADYRLWDVQVPALKKLVLARAIAVQLQGLQYLKLPKIETLAVRAQEWRRDYPFANNLLNRELPTLRELRIASHDTEVLRYIAEEAPRSAILRSVRTLSLGGEWIVDDVVASLLRHADSLRSLERLELHGVIAPADLHRLAAALGPVLVVHDRR